jgi:hypothetical protein
LAAAAVPAAGSRPVVNRRTEPSLATTTGPIHDWVKTYERSWSAQFERLDVVLEELKQKEEGDGSDE